MKNSARVLSNVSHPSRGAWIEILKHLDDTGQHVSHPSRGAWIEIHIFLFSHLFFVVAPLTGCVD